MVFLSFWHGHLSCEKNPYSKEHILVQKTGIFAGYSFPYKHKDKLHGLYILYMLHSKTESTVILKLSGERNNQSEFSPKYDQYSTYICTVRRREITVHYFTDFSQRWKLSNVCSPSVQFYKQFPKTCVHFLMYFLHPHLTHVVCNVRNFHAKNMCVKLWNG